MNKTIRTAIAAVLAVAVVSATAILFAGCGGNNQSSTAATTVPATTKATTATTKPGAQTSQNAQSQASQNAQDNSSSQAENSNGSSAAVDEDGYIDHQTAIANVRQQAGTGAQIVDSYKGYSPDGALAWVVTVKPITTGEGADTVIYYSGYQFCYPEQSSGSESSSNEKVDEDGYIKQETAVAQVKQQAGSGAEVPTLPTAARRGSSRSYLSQQATVPTRSFTTPTTSSATLRTKIKLSFIYFMIKPVQG